MEAISLKLDEHMLKNIDKILQKNNYSTRTEFVRDAIREKITLLEREAAIEKFLSLQGKGKPKNNLTDREIREQVSKELYEELQKRFTT